MYHSKHQQQHTPHEPQTRAMRYATKRANRGAGLVVVAAISMLATAGSASVALSGDRRPIATSIGRPEIVSPAPSPTTTAPLPVPADAVATGNLVATDPPEVTAAPVRLAVRVEPAARRSTTNPRMISLVVRVWCGERTVGELGGILDQTLSGSGARVRSFRNMAFVCEPRQQRMVLEFQLDEDTEGEFDAGTATVSIDVSVGFVETFNTKHAGPLTIQVW